MIINGLFICRAVVSFIASRCLLLACTHPGPAVLMAHGNRELIDIYRGRAEMYQRLGFTVLLREYRGYGRSAGSPSRERIAADFCAFYDHLVSLSGVDYRKVGFYETLCLVFKLIR